MLYLIKKYSFFIVLYFALCKGSTSLLNSVDLTIIPSKKLIDKGCRLSGCHIFFFLTYFVYICLNDLKLYEKAMNRNQKWGRGGSGGIFVLFPFCFLDRFLY